jgi:hypothetical protein
MSKITRRMLSTSEVVMVCRYLEQHQEALRGLSPKTILASVKDAVGIEMTRSNLENLKTVPGLEWVVVPRRAQVAKATSNERALAAAIIGLYDNLGLKRPVDLLDLLDEEEGDDGQDPAP